jgi:subtilisin family serine protease/archaellum component FlaF (FlaF/FlaG flagellin family)
MHKTRWRHFAVVIAITIMFLINTVTVTFSPVFLREVQAAQDSSANKGSTFQPTRSSDGFDFTFQDKDKRTSRAFSDFWGLFDFDRNTSLDGIKEYNDFAVADEDSIELVIGVDGAKPEAYAGLVDIIGKSQGKIVNAVLIEGEVAAMVADMPLNVVSSFRKEVHDSNLARYTEPNMKFQALSVPNDPDWSLQWGPQKIGADWAWNTTKGDPSVLVAVIDTGIDYDHPDLDDNYVALGYDWVNMDPDPMDDHGHGTHCAGIIAAVLDNSVGIAGLAQVRIMAEKGLDAGGWGTEVSLANAIIDAVDQGATILSNSWGGPYSELIYDAVKYAYNNSVLIVAAAGNAASRTKLYPAACDEVVAVTATDQYDNPAGFTSFGDWVEVAAPGVGIYSTVWDNSYTSMSGTSMACPHAAGVAALIWSQFPNATRDWVRAQLRYTADDLGNPGFDEYYGFGRINAKKAVEQAPPDHDLLIFDWKKPTRIQPGDVAPLNVTVLNFGTNAEQDVTVQLLVDGNLTDSTTIDYLANFTATTVSLSWNPLAEGTYNVTLYIIPVLGETATENNVMTKMISVRYLVGFVLFDQTRCDPIASYSFWVANLTDRGYAVDTYTAGVITADVLAGYDVFVIPQAWNSSSSAEVSAIQDFVLDGGGLLVIGDDYPSIYTSLTSFAGITWNAYYAWSGYTSDITPHDVTEGVSTAYFGAPMSELSVTSPARGLIRDSNGYEDIMLAVAEVGAGRVIGIADEDAVNDLAIGSANNFRLANNMIDWLLGVKYEHELVIRLDAPSYLAPDESSPLNATVYNRGLNNETDVELSLLINGTTVKNETIPLLVNGTRYTMNYMWTPSMEAVYNVTAYAPPVLNENVTLNNVNTKFVSVHYPLINPVEGQYANYFMNTYDSSGNLISVGLMNFTYEYYVEPYKIYVTAWQKDLSGYIYTGWMIVNTMNRFVESGSIWTGYWYPGWIETDIDIGSTITLLDGTATVNGTGIVSVGSRAIDCWEISYSMYGYPYTFWYDKASGLWIRMETVDPYSMSRMELLLADTNVPVGTQYEHDLGATLDARLHLQPSEASILKATVYNLGLNNESDVEIQILINGTEVASETLTNLVNGTWYTINHPWTPAAEGTYNITAYTPPVLNENVTINNIASKMVRVRYVEVALISDHSELLVIAPILDSMGIGYEIYNDNSMYLYTGNLSLLLNYKAVIFYTDYRWITSNEYSALESYLSLGGSLLVTGFDCLVSDALLASLVRSASTGDNTGEPDLYVVDATHPIIDGPYGSFPAGYHIYGLSSDCDMAEADTARNSVTVAELADGYDKIIATEGLPGKVAFWNGVGTNDWTWNSDCQTMFKNLIEWFTVRYQHELVASLQAPTFLEPSDSTMLNATVQNAGLNDEADINLQILINSTLVENVTIPLLANGTSQTINHLWTPTIAGKYNITVYASPVSGENITRNNIYSKLVPVQYAPRILAYVGYTDYWQEYSNTLRAIKSTFGPNYYLTELGDYTRLDSMLLGKDILLIPEQENADRYALENIGRTWSTTLSEFLENGGIIIVCDFNWGSGGTYSILTGAGLMSISSTNYRSWYSLYLIDPTDPLAEGVSSSFTAPDGTISFVTEETNVVINDGTSPVVIHKEIGRGHIALLGFDFSLSNNDTERILGNAVALASYITISTDPSDSSPGTEVTVSGTKATTNGTVSIYWDSMLMGNTTANNVGDFTYLLTVPSNATIGIHEIMALDTATGRTASKLFKVFLITLNPALGPVGTRVTIKGTGFTPESQAKITFNDMLIGYAQVDKIGNFTFIFDIPVSTAETQFVTAYDAEGCVSATFTVVDITPLDVQVDVGEMHFRGEIAEFYAQTTFKGKAVNAIITSAVLYKPDGATENVLAQSITTGLCKLSYAIPADASTGTYTLVIAAEYVTDTIQASGTSFKCFLISPTLTYTNAYVVEIRENMATVVIPDLGAIKLNLTAMNATLDNIFLKVTAINGTTATIQTTLGIMNGTITSIKDNMATIVVPGLGQIETDVSSLKGTQETWTIPQYVTMIMALIAAVTSMLSVMLFLRCRKTTEVR